MMRLQASLLVLAGSLASCTSAAPNPSQVWLALNGSERAVRLVTVQPDRF